MLETNDPQAQILDAEPAAGHLIKPDSAYRKLAQMGDKLFDDEDLADLYHPELHHDPLGDAPAPGGDGNTPLSG